MHIQEHTKKPIDSRTQFEVQTSMTVNLNFPNPPEEQTAPDPEAKTQSFRLFDSIAPSTFAERFPLLTFFAISCAILAGALFTEIECLKDSGYFWR
ncbi:MAG: hypothetical protein JST28_14550 [Acidobacteria bacterium]|nr:hypothetical protein [Acidobacteriota bacterium]